MQFNAVSIWAKNFLNLVFPLYCQTCREKLEPQSQSPLCPGCWQKIEYITDPWCRKCGKPLPANSPEETNFCNECQGAKRNFDSAWSACNYEGIIKECIILFKYKKRVILQKPLAGILTEFASQYLDMGNIDMLVPVPLHPLKLREREFNQSALLCQGIRRAFKCPVITDNLYRKRSTIPQIKLTAERRRENMKDAFGCRRPEEFNGKSVLLIDDVYTTGATINECASPLRGAGVRCIWALTLARG